MRTVWLIALALPLLAAAPVQRQQLTLAVPADGSGMLLPMASEPAASSLASPYAPAPTPNRDVRTPSAARASNEPTLAPTLFTTKTQFRGDGFSPGSTAQSDQERRLRPGAGFSLHMPFAPQ